MSFDTYDHPTLVTKATQKRAAKFKQLIKALKKKDLSAAEIQALLEISDHTQQHYCSLMLTAGVIVVSGREFIGKGIGMPIYDIADDAARVERYLRSINKVPTGPSTKPTGGGKRRDGYVPARKAYRIPPPHDVLAFFYYGRAAA